MWFALADESFVSALTLEMTGTENEDSTASDLPEIDRRSVLCSLSVVMWLF